jgi:hypothetical protein
MTTIYEQLWNPSYSQRSEYEWMALFATVTDSFAAYMEHPLQFSEVWLDDEEGSQHSCLGAQITIPVIPQIDLVFCGSIDISINRHDFVSVRALLLLFCTNDRLSVHPKRKSICHDWYWFDLDRTDSSMQRWLGRACMDESGEWEEYLTLDDWRR